MYRRTFLVALAVVAGLLLAGFKSAQMRVPEALAASPALEVSGHLVRTPHKPMAFGPYAVVGVHEGVEFSWSAELFGIRGGSARHRFRFTLESPEAEPIEVECRQRTIEAWRGGWTVDLTEAFTPRLACGVRSEGRLLRLVVGARGRGLRGAVMEADGGSPLLELRSLHDLEGTRLDLGEPAGYLFERRGEPLAAVETLNRGRVWLAPGLDAASRNLTAAASGALLLYKPELTAELQ